MLTGSADVLKWLEDNGPFWKLYRAGNQKAVMAEMIDPSHQSEAASKLDDFLGMLGTGSYILRANNNTIWNKGYKEVNFRLNQPGTGYDPGFGHPGITGAGGIDGYIAQRIGEAEQRWKQQQEIHELRQELAEMRNQPTGRYDRMQDVAVAVVVDKLMGKGDINQIVAKIMGGQDITQNLNMPMPQGEGDPADEAILQASLEKLHAKDPNMIANLKRLSDLADRDPETYQSAVGFLHNYNGNGQG